MKKILSTRKKRISFAILNGALALLSLAFLLASLVLAGLLNSQQEARRWKGESEQDFSQISCFIPVDEKISLDQVYAFRTEMMKKFTEASLNTAEETLFVDAWSTTGKLTASTSLGKGEASVIAVGGRFFDFHPIQLLNGNYIAEGDLMQDRVLLDEELAWLLFGGTELQGLELRINGVPFVVAGVIEREQDFASRKAYTAGMGLYMSYDAYAQLVEGAGINCYEVVMAEPVEGFAMSVAKESFPIGQGEILENTGRYSFGRMLGLVKQFGSRSMQTLGVVYPYWENAARCVEDWCALCCFFCLICAVLPVLSLSVLAIRYIRRGKDRLEEELIPKLKDNTQEAIRVRQRRAWEKKRGLHEPKQEK